MTVPREGQPGAALAQVPATAAVVAGAAAWSSAEANYASKARSANTLRAYAADWLEFTSWCAVHALDPLPAAPHAVSAYLAELASLGAKLPTMARRLAAIRFAHAAHELPSPTQHPRVSVVWEGIRREHVAEPQQAAPLMPPVLFDVVDACPTVKTWRTRGRAAEPHLGGLRDRALLVVGFVAALRRSELVALDVAHLVDHDNGLVLRLPRSKTNQAGEQAELVALPRGSDRPHRSPTAALEAWLTAAGITDGPVFRPVSKGNRALPRRLTAGHVNQLVQQAVTRAGVDADPYSAHSLRAGFVTHAHLRGASDRAIAHQTRHRSLATVGAYVRLETIWTDNAATQLDL